DALTKENISQYILKVENLFPRITIQHFAPDANLESINDKLLANLAEKHPSYLSKFSKDELITFLGEIKSEIHSKKR
ncbi:MAG: heptaprenyl pyrophosphate synthase subunit A, partial [Staphylococcus equorum]|nr:heptaprenyl pyrophosphate synthase subunit A [Staphylococcus equorum]